MSRSRRSSANSEFSISSRQNAKSMEDVFIKECKAAYLSLFQSTKDDITTKTQLKQILQQAGRNPSHKYINETWDSYDHSISYREFCEIMLKFQPNTKDELIKAFKRIDINNDGFISHTEFFKVLTSRGEKMTKGEVQKVIDDVDLNKDGKLDYSEFCTLMLSTSQQCQQINFKKLQMTRNEKVTPKSSSNFNGRSNYLNSKVYESEEEQIRLKKEIKPISRPSSSRSTPIVHGRSDSFISVRQQSIKDKKLKVTVPDASFFRNWNQTSSKGCFYIEDEEGLITSHHYQLDLPSATKLWITISPIYLNGDPTPNPVDTRLLILRKDSDSELIDMEMIAVAEQRDNLHYFWEGDLRSGSYLLIPVTSGCILTKRQKEPDKQIPLTAEDQNGETQLSRAFKEVLSDMFEMLDLDSNGLLNRSEFNWFQLLTSDEAVDDEAWDIVKSTFEMKKNEVTRKGFIDLHYMQAQDENGNEELADTVRLMGYNRSLILDQACPFQLNVYGSECEPALKVVSFGTDDDARKIEQKLVNHVVSVGEKHTFKHIPDVCFHVQKTSSRISCVVENLSKKTIGIDVDCLQMKNCTGSKTKNFSLRVKQNSKMLVHHVIPIEEGMDWIYKCGITSSEIRSTSHSVQSRPRSASKKDPLLSLF